MSVCQENVCIQLSAANSKKSLNVNDVTDIYIYIFNLKDNKTKQVLIRDVLECTELAVSVPCTALGRGSQACCWLGTNS